MSARVKGEFAGTGEVVRSPEQKSPCDRVWPVGEWQTTSLAVQPPACVTQPPCNCPRFV